MKTDSISIEEESVLNLIAIRSKMDCWFDITFDKHNNQCIYDREEKRFLSLKDGISLLYQGITDLDDYYLSESQKETFNNLLRRLSI